MLSDGHTDGVEATRWSHEDRWRLVDAEAAPALPHISQVLAQTRHDKAGPLLLQLCCNSISGVALELAEVVDTCGFGDVIEGLQQKNFFIFRAHVRKNGKDFGPRQTRIESECREGVLVGLGSFDQMRASRWY